MTKKKIKIRRKAIRAELFPKKVFKEDYLYYRMRSRIFEVFPNKDDRVEYINHLLEALTC